MVPLRQIKGARSGRDGVGSVDVVPLSLCLEIKPVLLRPRPHLSALARSLLSRVICGLDDDDGDHDRRRRLFPRMSLRGLIHGKDKGKHATAHRPSRVGRYAYTSGLVRVF